MTIKNKNIELMPEDNVVLREEVQKIIPSIKKIESIQPIELETGDEMGLL